MKKPILLVIGILISAIAFSQSESRDSIWIAKYQSVNGVTKYLGSTTLKTPSTNITDAALKVIGTIDVSGRITYTVPKQTLIKGRYAVYNTAGQLLYVVKID
jgi:hypothetical protein